MEGGSGATFAAPASFTCLRRGAGRGFCRFASQRTGYLRDNPEGCDLWDPARKRDDAEETAHCRIGLSTLAVLNRQTQEHAHREIHAGPSPLQGEPFMDLLPEELRKALPP